MTASGNAILLVGLTARDMFELLKGDPLCFIGGQDTINEIPPGHELHLVYGDTDDKIIEVLKARSIATEDVEIRSTQRHITPTDAES